MAAELCDGSGDAPSQLLYVSNTSRLRLSEITLRHRRLFCCGKNGETRSASATARSPKIRVDGTCRCRDACAQQRLDSVLMPGSSRFSDNTVAMPSARATNASRLQVMDAFMMISFSFARFDSGPYSVNPQSTENGQKKIRL